MRSFLFSAYAGDSRKAKHTQYDVFNAFHRRS
jgi:hypothetical protein